MEVETIGWFIIFLVLIVFEIITLGLTSIWFAVGALVAFVLALIGVPLIVQVIVFFVVSVIALLTTRPLARKYINSKTIKTNVDEMAGKTGIVLNDIDNINGKGLISVEGVEWTARSQDNEIIVKDTIVEVIRIEGVKAIVTPKEAK